MHFIFKYRLSEKHDSEVIEIPRDQWKKLYTSDGVSATMHCPECLERSSLYDHEIDEDGTVKPSVVCPRDSCSFHDHVRLLDWPPE